MEKNNPNKFLMMQQATWQDIFYAFICSLFFSKSLASPSKFLATIESPPPLLFLTFIPPAMFQQPCSARGRLWRQKRLFKSIKSSGVLREAPVCQADMKIVPLPPLPLSLSNTIMSVIISPLVSTRQFSASGPEKFVNCRPDDLSRGERGGLKDLQTFLQSF